MFGGFKVQGKSEEAARALLADAKAVEEAGAFAVVIEAVPAALAQMITDSVSIPTIGIGAGAGCDGQILVYQDMLGMFSDFTPKFVKRYANVGEVMREAFANYAAEVASGAFPTEEHTYKIKDDVLDEALLKNGAAPEGKRAASNRWDCKECWCTRTLKKEER